MRFELFQRELNAFFFRESENGLDVAIEVAKILGRVGEVLKGVRDVAEGVFEILLCMGVVAFGVCEIDLRVCRLFSTCGPVGERMLEVVNKVLEVFKCMGAVALGMLEIFDGVGQVVAGMPVVENRMFDLGCCFGVGFEEGWEFGFHRGSGFNVRAG